MELAEHAGFCFGVRRAVETAQKHAPALTLGPIINNDQAVEALIRRGVTPVEGVEAAPAGSRVILRSHGVSREETECLIRKGCQVLDATCPFVTRIHQMARGAAEAGRKIIVIGEARHPEVRGILGWALEGSRAVMDETEAKALDAETFRGALAVAQTTQTRECFEKVAGILRERIPEVEIRCTICTATAQRQAEAAEMARRNDVMIVVGGKQSSNSRKLYALTKAICERTYFVQTAAELGTIRLQKGDRIGITAGASTPDCIIKEVVTAMNDIEKQGIQSEELQEQAEAATTESDFMADVEKTLVQIRPGQTIIGTVVQITDDEVCVNVGYKADGLVKKADLSSTDVKIGDEIEVEVVKVNDGEGNVLLSQRNIVNRKNWDEIVA